MDKGCRNKDLGCLGMYQFQSRRSGSLTSSGLEIWVPRFSLVVSHASRFDRTLDTSCNDITQSWCGCTLSINTSNLPLNQRHHDDCIIWLLGLEYFPKAGRSESIANNVRVRLSSHFCKLSTSTPFDISYGCVPEPYQVAYLLMASRLFCFSNNLAVSMYRHFQIVLAADRIVADHLLSSHRALHSWHFAG